MRLRIAEETSVLDLAGSFTIGPDLALFEREANRIITERRPEKLLLNLSNVMQLDSAGVGEIMILYDRARASNCRLGFVSPRANIRHILRITRVDGVIPVYKDEAEALASR
jgi:anti-anti-sigma factor